MLTLLTRAIMAKMAESAMAVVLMAAWASLRAIACPPYLGAPSATTTCQKHASFGRPLAKTLTAPPLCNVEASVQASATTQVFCID